MDTLRKPLLLPLFFAIGGCQVWQGRDINSLPPTAAVPETSEPGRVEIRYWMNIQSARPSSLTTLSRYPDNPDEIEALTSLQQTQNRADNYGAMVRGFITPPQSGLYRFYVSGDDQMELWLSDSQSADEANRIATVPGWTYPGEYDKHSSQRSANIQLSAGQRYYFQIIFKELAGDDHFSVAWEGPGISRQVIDESALSSWAQPSFPNEEDAAKAYSQGYRIGFFDAQNALSFNSEYPPLDSDQDGLYDNWETFHGLNPSDPEDAASDPDDDFLTASEEFELGTNPQLADTDGDGISDGAEYAYNLSPLDSSDATLDADGDGISNLAEYLASTDLNDPEDFPAEERELISGFIGQYYVGRSFNSFLSYQKIDSIKFNWSSSAPITDAPADDFSVRWTGSFYPPHESGNRDYRFNVRTDDGVRLYIDSQLVIDQWVDRSATSNNHVVTLSPGQVVPVKIEYYEAKGGAVAQASIYDVQTGQELSQSSVIQSPDPQSENAYDSDNDDIPDTWELKYGTDMMAQDASSVVAANSDITVLEAYQSNLNPWTLEPMDGTEPEAPEPEEPVPTEPDPSVQLSWSIPEKRTDGSNLSPASISHYKIFYGLERDNLNMETDNIPASETSYTIEGLERGIWYFAIRVYDNNEVASQPSNIETIQIN